MCIPFWTFLNYFKGCPMIRDQHSFLSSKVLLIYNLSFNLGISFRIQWNQVFLEREKITCYPDADIATQEKCVARGCIWEAVMRILILFHDMFSHSHFKVNFTVHSAYREPIIIKNLQY